MNDLLVDIDGAYVLAPLRHTWAERHWLEHVEPPLLPAWMEMDGEVRLPVRVLNAGGVGPALSQILGQEEDEEYIDFDGRYDNYGIRPDN